MTPTERRMSRQLSSKIQSRRDRLTARRYLIFDCRIIVFDRPIRFGLVGRRGSVASAISSDPPRHEYFVSPGPSDDVWSYWISIAKSVFPGYGVIDLDVHETCRSHQHRELFSVAIESSVVACQIQCAGHGSSQRAQNFNGSR